MKTQQAVPGVFGKQCVDQAPLKSVVGSVVHGFVWLNALAFFSTGLSFIQTIIIARVLDPNVVGLVAVFYIIQGALDSFTATGFGKAIIQRKEMSQDYIDTAFVTHLLRGILLASLVFFSAPLVVRMLDAPGAQHIVQAMAISIVFQGARNPGALFFMRWLTFQKQFIWHASGALTRFIVTVTLLYVLRNVWAIVCGVLVYEVVMLLLSFLLIDVRPNFKWDGKAFRDLFSYGKWVLLAAIVAAIERQGNQIVTVKLLGEASLGVLFLGLRIAMLPKLIVDQLKNTLFPVFSRLQDSYEETKKLYQHSMGVIALFMFPVTGCAFVFAEPFTRLFLKASWVQVAEILGLLVCARTIQSLAIGIALLNAKGMPKFAFFNRLIQALIIIIGIYPLVKGFGLKGVAILYVFISVASFVFSSAMVVRCLRFKIAIFGVLLIPALVSIVVSFLFYVGQRIIIIDSISLFCIAISAFLVLYFTLICAWGIVDKTNNYVSLPLAIELIKENIGEG